VPNYLFILALLACLLSYAPATAQPGSVHLALGNPSGALADETSPKNYLIVRDQYALSYHRDWGIPNWVSWHLQQSDLGDVERYSGQFITDTSLPVGWYQVKHGDYTNTGYDRGHMTPSADRTATEADNVATFLMTNIVPQVPAHNRGVWANLEDDSRDLVAAGNELYIVAGNTGTLGTIAQGKITIPAELWKVALVLPAGDNDVTRVTTATQVIAVTIPNTTTVVSDWTTYRTSIDCIEQATGYDLFAVVDDAVEAIIEAQGGTCMIMASYRLYVPLARLSEAQ
jgi:endonuclease G, mitochondrial